MVRRMPLLCVHADRLALSSSTVFGVLGRSLRTTSTRWCVSAYMTSAVVL